MKPWGTIERAPSRKAQRLFNIIVITAAITTIILMLADRWLFTA